MTEKFCLRWNDFETNISSAFRELRDDQDFFDVTLACDEEETLKAHKVILSACSPFFRSLLRRNRHEHPLLYMKGVKFTDLTSVLNFMYHGEVNVAQEDLNSFLAVAEDLKVKGLTQKNESSESKGEGKKMSRDGKGQQHFQQHQQQQQQPQHQSTSNYVSQQDDDIQEVVPVKTEPAAAAALDVDTSGAVEQYDDQMYDEQYTDADYGYDQSVVMDSADGNKGEIFL